MISDKTNDAILTQLFEVITDSNPDGVRSLLEGILNLVMKMEREQTLKAQPYERSSQRLGHANGFKDKTLNTRLGSLQLQVPQTRGIAFYPQSIEKGSRSERALKLAVAEMYLQGVSTRKVEAITQALCGLDFTSTQVSRATKELDEQFEIFRNRLLGSYQYVFLDAVYLKVRHNGTVIDQAVLIAYGINSQGTREILGVSTSLSEAEIHWRTFLESLVKRGLRGIELIISDDHAGLRKARKRVFPSMKWQRCQFHLSQNAQSYAPKKNLREPIAQAMREIFNSSSRKEALEKTQKVIRTLEKPAPEFTRWLEENIEEGLTCLNYPIKHQRRIRTTNGLERVNREIKRRTRVAVLFPNGESALRLVTGILMEIHEEWVTQRKYLDMENEENDSLFYEEKKEQII